MKYLKSIGYTFLALVLGAGLFSFGIVMPCVYLMDHSHFVLAALWALLFLSIIIGTTVAWMD